MFKDKNCCGFFIKLCRKICIKPTRESVKPEIDIISFHSNRANIRESFKQKAIKNQIAYKSSIHKPKGVSIKNPSLGFISNIENPEPKPKSRSLVSEVIIKNKEENEVFSDNTVYTEQLPSDVVMNMDEAYKIIIDSESPSLEAQADYSSKFSKVVVGMDFKKIMEEGPDESL